MTDKELKELVAGLAIAQQENEIQFAETDDKVGKALKIVLLKLSKKPILN